MIVLAPEDPEMSVEIEAQLRERGVTVIDFSKESELARESGIPGHWNSEQSAEIAARFKHEFLKLGWLEPNKKRASTTPPISPTNLTAP